VELLCELNQWVHNISSLVPRPVDSAIAGPEGAKNLAGESPPPDSDPFSDAESEENLVRLSRKFAASPNRRFEFHKRSQFFIGTHNQTLSVAAMRIGNEDCSSFAIYSCNTAQLQPALLRLSAIISQYFTGIGTSTLPLPSALDTAEQRQHLVELSSVDDEGLGEELSVVWELEPGVTCFHKAQLPALREFDAPRVFDAFWMLLHWGSVSTACATSRIA
jgi:hypothetical protein